MEIIETTKMSTRGQIIIPKDIRNFISADESTIFTVSPVDSETIIMRKIDTEKMMKTLNTARKKTMKLSDQEINDEIQKARKD